MHRLENAADRRRAHLHSPAQAISQAGPQLPLDGIVRLADRPLPAWMVMRWPTSLSGADQVLVAAVLIPWAISFAQGWSKAMACTGSPREGSVALREVHSRETAVTGPLPAFTSVIMPAATAALMMWWRQQSWPAMR